MVMWTLGMLIVGGLLVALGGAIIYDGWKS
jgi:hypothetical protein